MRGERQQSLERLVPVGSRNFFLDVLDSHAGVGVTDASTILTLVAAQPDRVLASSVLQLESAAFLALAVPGLALRFAAAGDRSGRLSVALLAVGACGYAADAIYHQLAYEMVQPGIDQAAMLPVMKRMQTIDLLYLLPMILAFLLGCATLAVSAARMKLVSKWNPMLYALSVAIGLAGRVLTVGLGIPGRVVGLICLGLLSVSLAWVGVALARNGLRHAA